MFPDDLLMPFRDAIFERHNVRFSGRGKQTILFSHGYGCDQTMWRHVLPAFEGGFRCAAYDLVGCGGSRVAFDPQAYASLDGYAEDLLEVCRALGDEPVVLVGHSVSAMIGAAAAIRDPRRFRGLVMVGPSPCYMKDGSYDGGFTREDIASLIALLDADQKGWAAMMAPTIMGNDERPELASELAGSFCRMDPVAARHFARVTFESDSRADLPRIPVPVLVLQCSDDVIAPVQVGQYVHRQVPDSRYVLMQATGHCPHLSAPEETAAAIRDFIDGLSSRR
jgi:sigma-B regulation protein RsbQ